MGSFSNPNQRKLLAQLLIQTKQFALIPVAGHPQIVRSCYFGDINNIQAGCQSDPSMPFVKQLGCDVCTKDECNGSSSLAPIAGAILLFFGVARLLA